jgi:predicted GH43/DUF377 family glycosyl hydrolase
MQIELLNRQDLKEKGNITRCALRCVVKRKGIYHIFEEDYIDKKWWIFRRISQDGINISKRERPLFRLGKPGSFNESGVADPTVIFDKIWKMWFDAVNGNLIWDKIGYAISEDSFHWKIQKPALERGIQGEWDSRSVHHPVVLKYDKYYLYYSGSDDNCNVKHIGLAVSLDGLNWVKYPHPVIKTSEGWDNKYIRPSKPVFIKDQWFMFYWGYNGIHSIGTAVSKDLIHWEKIGRIAGGTNEHNGITGSHPIWDRGKIRIWYALFDSYTSQNAEIKIE